MGARVLRGALNIRMAQRLRRWFSDWLGREIPPHSYALLRIVLGLVGLISLVGLTPVAMYWPLDGLAALPSDGFRGWVAARDLGSVVGYALFATLLVSFVAMTIGFRSDSAVLASFMGLIAQSHWNGLPLSSAHQVMKVLLFSLLWAETGQVWSFDAKWSAARPPRLQPAWPLWLMRCQVAIVYLSSGLYKFAYPVWRDGTAVHLAMNLNAFHRFPWPIPPQLAPLEALLAWGTLVFELGFWLMVIFRRTRPWALVAGVGLHLGLFAALELGPFSLLMISSYICYLEPAWVRKIFAFGTK